MRLVHAGFQKCASTFLQKQIFPQISGYQIVPNADWWCVKWEPDDPGDLGSNVIVSCEGLTSFRSYGDQGLPFFPHEIGIHNIGRFLGHDVTVLFVLRRQDSLVDSYYRFKSDFADPTDMFLDYPLRQRNGFFWGSRSRRGELLRCFDFHAPIMLYRAIFGAERVKVLFYEDLVHDPERFFQGLSETFGMDLTHFAQKSSIRENVSEQYGFTAPLAVRAINRLTGYRLARLLPRSRKELSGEHRTAVMQWFTGTNRALFAQLGLEDRYGYCTEGALSQ